MKKRKEDKLLEPYNHDFIEEGLWRPKQSGKKRYIPDNEHGKGLTLKDVLSLIEKKYRKDRSEFLFD